MLEFYSDNEKFDLPDDIEVNLTFENPFLSQDRIPVPYSMPFTLPATPTNMRKFKHPKRVTSVGSWDAVPGYFMYNGIKFSQGNIRLTEVEKSLSTDYVGVLANNLVKKMLNALSGITDFFYSFGTGSRTFADLTTGWADTYKDTINTQALYTAAEFAACPVRVKEEEWANASDSFGNYNATILYFNMWSVSNENYVFTGGVSPIHTAIYPQPYIHYLFAQVFGSSLNTNFFADDAELSKLCMVTTYHKMFTKNLMAYFKGILIDNPADYVADNYMNLNSFFNKYPFNDFLREILKIFCCSLIPRSDGKLDIIHNKTIINGTDVVDWNDKLADIPLISIEKGKRYDYGYSGEAMGDATEYYPLVDSIDEIIDAGTNAGTYQVTATGEVYEKVLLPKEVPEDPDVFTYKLIKSNLGGNIIEASEDVESYSISSAVKPIPMTIDDYWSLNTSVVKDKWYVPAYSGDRKKNDEAPYIGFFRGYHDLYNHTLSTDLYYLYPGHKYYPFLCPYVRDKAGNVVGDYSLAWEGADGLINKFHSEFKTYIEKDKHILKGKFRLTEMDLKNIDFTKKYNVRGMLFYIRKIESSLRINSISLSSVELLEA